MELAGHKCVGFCEFDKYATASYTAMHLMTEEQKNKILNLSMRQRQKEILKEEYRNGEWYENDITKVSARNLPKADCWCFGAPCFVKGTLITTHRGLIPIEDIHYGDFVLTHKNRFQKVIKPMINVKQGIYTLKVQGSPNTEVTGNHRFYVRDKQKVWNNSLRKYENILSEPYWKEVQNFNGNELIQFTSNPHDKNIYDLTEEECWLIGRYIADGYIRNDERRDRPSKNQKVIFCIGKGKEEEFETRSKSYDMHTSQQKSVKKYITGNKKLFSLCTQCGRGAKNKSIPQFIMDLNPHLLKSFISGYLSGDGSYSNGVWKATSVSKKLIYQLGQCISKTYHVGYSIHYTKRPAQYQIEDRIVNQNDTWQIVFRIHPEKALFYYIDGMLWQPVKKIEFNPKRKEIVYNMEVENDNSYTANNMGVHNCQDFSIAGKRKGLEGDRSSLIREIFRLLEEQEEKNRPEWLIYENVKGMFSSNRGLDYLSILSELDRLGYDIEWQNINSKWFVPQNRERIYTIGHLRGKGGSKIFPIIGTDGENCVQLIGTTCISRKSACNIHNINGCMSTILSRDYKDPQLLAYPIINVEYLNQKQNKSIFKENSNSSSALTAHDKDKIYIKIKEATKQGYSIAYEGDSINLSVPGSKTRRGRIGHGVAQTLDTSCNQGIIVQVPSEYPVYAIWYEKHQCYIAIRKLTPKECFRLQGWSDEYFERAALVNSDSQLYKQAGNGVTVNVVYAIGKKMKKTI